jgi:hypothetical protein
MRDVEGLVETKNRQALGLRYRRSNTSPTGSNYYRQRRGRALNFFNGARCASKPTLSTLRRIELMSKFQDAMRRVITGDNAQGQSVVIIDGGPSSEKGNPDLGEMFEIWEDAAFGPLTPSANEDLGATRPVLGPRKSNFQVRWFVIHPQPDSVTKPQADPSRRERFAEFYGAGHIIDQTLHPGMHETHSIDIICLLQGEASLILESGETRLRPGNVVIQRGTNHAWKAHGNPALLLAVLIDRDLGHG